MAAPYWSSEDKVQARLRLAGVFALTLATTGISVGFNYLGRDFYNALASKQQKVFSNSLPSNKLVGAAATDTHPTATLIRLWLQSFFSLYLQIVVVENSLQFCRCVIFANRSRACWICCTHFILGQKVC